MQSRSPPKHRHDGTSPLPLGMDWSPPPRKWNGRDTVWPHDHRTGWSYCVTIPSWVLLPKSRDADPVVFYRVQVGLQSPEGVTTVRGVLRRFNDFLRLFSDLKKAFPKKNLPPAPPKGLLRMKSRALLDERRCSLEEWMAKLLSDLDLSRSFAVALFLELEAAARSSFQDTNQNVPEALGSGNSSVASHQPQNDSALSVVAGGSSLTSDYGSDTAYENSELGTPTLGRHESSDVAVEEFSLDEDLPNPIDRLVKYGVSNIDEGLFMGEAILEQLEGFDRRKIHGNHVNISGKNLENGNISKAPYLTGNDLELFTEPDHFKITGHTRKLSSDSISSDVSSLRGSESSNSGLPHSSGNGSAYLSGAVETSSAPEILLGNTEVHASGDGQVILPMDQRGKLNRVMFSFQRRLVTVKTDMEDLISRLNQEIAVKDYLMTKVKDLEVELDTTKQKSKENLEQAILAERERLTQMQWDMEELRQRSYEMELKLKSKQDGESSSETTGASFSPRRDELLQELDESKQQVGNLQKRYEELELRSKADLKVLVKEVKSLQNSQSHLKQELSQSIEEKRKVEKLLEEEKQVNRQCETALNKLLQECKTIHNVLQDCVVNITAGDVKDHGSSEEAIQFSSMLDERIGHITAQAHLLAQEGHAAASDIYGDNGVNDNTRMVEDELKTTIANIIINSSTLFRKQANSVLQCSPNDSETETAEAPNGKS
ncbi:PX domain-containing protein [Psidium guajava]|nr:PX domain-containing protein [Psidium guajava]